MRHYEIPFDEVTVPLARENTRAEILRYTPSGKCPALQDGEIVVWDSLAIIEYLAESFQQIPVWPRARAPRAQARALSAEMHSGFASLRAALPMNIRRRVEKRELTAETAADVARLESAFAMAQAEFSGAGGFIFGDFCAADAMFAPVVNRLHVYAIDVSAKTRAYMDRIMALSAWREWSAQAQAEPWVIGKYEFA
jgi:glutathione S-transferase